MNPKTISLIERLRERAVERVADLGQMWDHKKRIEWEAADALEAQQARIAELEAVREAAIKYRDSGRSRDFFPIKDELDKAIAACKEGE